MSIGCDFLQLTDGIQYVKGVGPKKKAELNRLGLFTVCDLLTYFPRTYEDQSVLTKISELQAGEKATVAGTIMNVSERQGGRRGMSILMALIGDGTGILQVTWFNQKYLKPKLKVGKKVFVTGKAVYAFGGRGQFAMSQLTSFQILDEDDTPENMTGIMPVYPATERLNQKFFRKLLQGLLAADLTISELIPKSVVARYRLLPRKTALHDIHFPADFAALKAARNQLAFEELYLIQCGLLLLKRQAREHSQGIRHLLSSELVAKLLKSLPFDLTNDQQRTWQEIQRDMESPLPMRRLVQGDVGSGRGTEFHEIDGASPATGV